MSWPDSQAWTPIRYTSRSRKYVPRYLSSATTPITSSGTDTQYTRAGRCRYASTRPSSHCHDARTTVTCSGSPLHVLEGPADGPPYRQRTSPPRHAPATDPLNAARAAATSRQTGGVHPPQLLLEVGDLVPQPRGQLELQVTRRVEHLIGELLDEIGELGAGHVAGVAAGHDARARPPTLAGGPLAPGRIPPRPADLHLVLHLAVHLVEDVGDLLAQRARVEAVLGVVSLLLGPPPIGLVDRRPHGLGDRVGVHVDLAGHVPRGAPDRLDQRPLRSEEA